MHTYNLTFLFNRLHNYVIDAHSKKQSPISFDTLDAAEDVLVNGWESITNPL